MSDPLEYPNEMLMRCAENCGSLRDKVAKLEEANKVLMEALDKIANCKQGNVVKYIQTVDSLALDAIDAANREPQ